MKKFCFMFLMVVLARESVSLTAGPLDQWQSRTPWPNQGSFYGAIAFVNGAFVAAGKGLIQTSPDGRSWTSQYVRASQEMMGIAYGNGVYVAVGIGHAPDSGGSMGVILTSSNGVTWSVQPRPDNISALYGIAFGNGAFVVVGMDSLDMGSSILTSADGVHWIRTAQSSDDANDWRAVTYANDTFVVVGYNWQGIPFSSVNAPILTSTDGQQWTPRDSGLLKNAALDGITYGNGRFVTMGYGTILTSSDGVIWTDQSQLNGNDQVHGGHITYGGGKFAISAYGSVTEIFTSTDGAKWTGSDFSPNGPVTSLAYGSGSFVAVGPGMMATSSDGINWTNIVNTTPPPYWSDVAYGNGTYVVVESDPDLNGQIMISTDGTGWTQTNNDSPASLTSVIWANEAFVAVGRIGAILRSADGRKWTYQDSGTSTDLSGIAYGNGLFVVGGADGSIMTSTSGANWVVHAGLFPSLIQSRIAFGNGMFVLVNGPTGNISTSSNGLEWTPQNPGTTTALYAVGFGNGLFVAAGQQLVVTSKNGINWTPGKTFPWFYTRRVSYANGTYVIVGANGTLLTSNNGVDWLSHDVGGYMEINGVAFGNNSIVVAGSYGTIFQSGSLTAPEQRVSSMAGLADGTFSLSLTGSIGETVKIQATSDLLDWKPLVDLMITNSTTQFIDYDATNYTQRFYRTDNP